MRIAFVTTYDPSDPRQWSGIPRAMIAALSALDVEITVVGPIRGAAIPRVLAAGRTMLARSVRRRYRRDRDPALLRSMAADVAVVIRSLRPDIVLSPGTVPVAYLECDRPLSIWTDATFANVVDFYPEFSRLTAASTRHGHLMEQSALDRCDAAFYSSSWAADLAVARYGIARERVSVAPFGPNLPVPRDRSEVEHVVAKRSTVVCRIAFICTDWRRKGGADALAIAHAAVRAGVPVELILVGNVPRSVRLPDFVRRVGWIDKRDPRAVGRLCDLLRQSHFLLFPTRADTTPVSIMEAAAWGVPTVARDIGAVRELLQHDVTGGLLAPAAEPEEYARYIASVWSDRRLHEELALNAFEAHRGRFNWSTSARHVRDRLQSLL